MNSFQSAIRSRVGVATIIGTVIGYILVLGTFADLLPIYPTITLETSTLLSDLIALVNFATVLCLVAGWYWIRNGDVAKHRLAMGAAFGLILIFLVLYLTRVGGGGTKNFVGPTSVYYVYLVMLGIHILLSVLAVPLVLFALFLGLTHTPAELRQTPHKVVGRVAAGTWLISLILGIVAYLLLEHLYDWEYVLIIPPSIGVW